MLLRYMKAMRTKNLACKEKIKCLKLKQHWVGLIN